jgi:hypothetical protein
MHRSETHASFLGVKGFLAVRNARFLSARGFKMMRDAPCWVGVGVALRLAAVCKYLSSVA